MTTENKEKAGIENVAKRTWEKLKKLISKRSGLISTKISEEAYFMNVIRKNAEY